LAAVVAGIGAPRPAAAESAAATSARLPGWLGLEIAFGTAAPVYLGAEGTVGLGSHFRLHPVVGLLPSPYVDLINAVSTGYNWYDQATADLIEAALQSSLVIGSTTGWKPWSRRGFEVTAGYMGVFLGGASTTADVVEAVLDTSLANVTRGRDVEIDSKLHTFQVGCGWTWVIKERWSLRTSASYLQCFSASTTSEIPARSPTVRQLADDVETDLNDYLDDIYTSYVKTAVLHVAFGYRF
jgi:hypothetical protein